MNYRTLVFITIVVLFAVLASPVYAQYDASDRTRLGLGFSTFHPSGGELQAINGYWLSPRIDLHLTYDKQDRPQTMLSLSWFSGTGSNNSATGKMVPIVASYIKHFSTNTDRSLYAGAGLAADFAVYRGFVPFLGQSEASGTQFGTTWFAGYEYGAWYTEARYDLISPLAFPGGGSVNFSGLTVTLGTHFGF